MVIFGGSFVSFDFFWVGSVSALGWSAEFFCFWLVGSAGEPEERKARASSATEERGSQKKIHQCIHDLKDKGNKQKIRNINYTMKKEVGRRAADNDG